MLILNLSPKIHTIHAAFFASPISSPKNPRRRFRSQIQFRTRRRRIITAQSNGDDTSADGPDRLISAICYFYPFFDGVQYGKYVITQYAPIQVLIQPLVPAIRVFKSFPLNGFLVFLTLYFVVVRNPNFSRLSLGAWSHL
ncbi:protein TIC 20-v, chloroplastic-like isoform X2 [Momordica charantia]|uniref:Protein TIC 20 n=1 Tax=Momordica charantia TaxID=3673 RepID=A0A6J1CQF0_MOMCH|nr:protein TIC 20-v, chloroplastic-like isoform X2 [Momordica charantia]